MPNPSSVQHGVTLDPVPTRHPRQMVTLTPERAALIEQVATLEGQRPELGRLIDEGARVRITQLQGAADAKQGARRRLATRVREGSLAQDVEAADAVKRLGLEI
jgi:hypothetical protein